MPLFQHTQNEYPVLGIGYEVITPRQFLQQADRWGRIKMKKAGNFKGEDHLPQLLPGACQWYLWSPRKSTQKPDASLW